MSLIVLRALALVQMLYYTFRLLTVGLLVSSERQCHLISATRLECEKDLMYF